jgi:hypothetical protein
LNKKTGIVILYQNETNDCAWPDKIGLIDDEKAFLKCRGKQQMMIEKHYE